MKIKWVDVDPNNLNMDLKEEIETLNTELGKLRIFKDDYEEMIKE